MSTAAKIQQFIDDMDLLDTWLNGGISDTITTENGDTIRSPANLVNYLELSLASTIAEVQDLRDEILGYRDAAETFRDDAQTSETNVLNTLASKADKVSGAVVGNVAELDSAGNLVDSGAAASDIHVQNTDTFLDQGGANEVTAANAKTAVDNNHVQNTDIKLDDGGANEVTAAELKTVVDNESNYARKDQNNTFTGNNDFTGDLTVNTNSVFHAGNDGEGSGLDADTLRGLTPDEIGTSFTNGSSPFGYADHHTWHNAGFVDTKGRVWTVGYNASYALGLGNNITADQLIVRRVQGFGVGEVITKLLPMNEGFVALSDAGKVYTWGNNNHSQCGDGTTTDVQYPYEVGLTNIVDIYTGSDLDNSRDQVWARASNGDLYRWGSNADGNLGDGTTSNITTPTKLGSVAGSNNTWSMVTLAGYSSTFIVDTTGKIFSTGRNGNGQLGLGDTTNRSSFVQVTLPGTPGTPVKIVCAAGSNSAGSGHISTSYILDTNDELFATGYNAYGQIGDGTTTQKTSFVSVQTNITDFWAGGGQHAHVFSVDTTDNVWCWGYNAWGQLGLNNTTNQSSPQESTDIETYHKNTSNVKKILMMGGRHFNSTTVLFEDGTAKCVGYTTYGRLGNNDYSGSNANIDEFEDVICSEFIDDIGTSGYTSQSSFFVLTDKNEIMSCGYNVEGTLGLNHTTSTAVLQKIITP